MEWERRKIAHISFPFRGGGNGSASLLVEPLTERSYSYKDRYFDHEIYKWL